MKIVVYPNPNNGTFYIAIPVGINALQMNLTDISRIVFKKWNSITENIITLTGINPGIYFIKIYGKVSGGFFTQKIIVN